MNETISHLICPITHELPFDPVIAEDGHIYDRKAIEAHLQLRLRSPLTNQPMGSKLMVAKHVTNVLESLVGKVEDERLIVWKTGKDADAKAKAALKFKADMLIHAFHCRHSSTRCNMKNCRIAKLMIRRIVDHARICKCTSECKVCKLWQSLQKTTKSAWTQPAERAPLHLV